MAHVLKAMCIIKRLQYWKKKKKTQHAYVFPFYATLFFHNRPQKWSIKHRIIRELFNPLISVAHQQCELAANGAFRWQIAVVCSLWGLLLDNAHVCDRQSGGLHGAGGQMKPLSAPPPQTPWKHTDDHPEPPLASLYVQHVRCSVLRGAGPIKTEMWNLLRPSEDYFGALLLSTAHKKNTKMIRVLNFTISFNTTWGFIGELEKTDKTWQF